MDQLSLLNGQKMIMEKPVNVLLVEDDPLDQIDVKRTLARKGILYRLNIARNGEEALAMLRGKMDSAFPGKPDVVIMDLNMPKMSGLEFLSEIRSDAALKDLKVFVVTTSDEASDRDAVIELGVSGFITKPLKLENPSSRDAFNLMIDLMNVQR
jgi:CheY-like chemotaxis protein